MLSVGLLGGTAWAAPGQAMTAHSDGTGQSQVELDFNPNSPNTPPGVTLPAGCWMTAAEGIVSTGGNQIMHQIGNKTGFWVTTTYTGDAAVYPLVIDPATGVPVQDHITGNDLVDMTGSPIATGHLTTWFGAENNGGVNSSGASKVDVGHATASFHGTLSDGTPVNLNGHFHIGTNQFGQPTAMGGNVTC